MLLPSLTPPSPLVSVIMPVYNGAAFLAAALESVLAQNYQPLEIIVSDDGSTDDSAAVARRFAGTVRYTSQPHSGRPAVGRNRGLALARGELVAFLDQDDLWTRDKLARQLACLAQEPAVQVVLGRTQRLVLAARVDGQPVFEPYGEPLEYRLVSCALFRRAVFERVGPFDEALRFYGDDLDWFIRAQEVGVAMRMLDAVTLYWRLHAGNSSHAPGLRDHARGFDHALTEVLKKAQERRRQREGRP